MVDNLVGPKEEHEHETPGKFNSLIKHMENRAQSFDKSADSYRERGDEYAASAASAYKAAEEYRRTADESRLAVLQLKSAASVRPELQP